MSTYVSVVLTGDMTPPRPRAQHNHGNPIGSVSFDGERITVQACDPAHLLVLADAFQDAARMLSDELDKAAAREINAEAVPA